MAVIQANFAKVLFPELKKQQEDFLAGKLKIPCGDDCPDDCDGEHGYFDPDMKFTNLFEP